MTYGTTTTPRNCCFFSSKTFCLHHQVLSEMWGGYLKDLRSIGDQNHFVDSNFLTFVNGPLLHEWWAVWQIHITNLKKYFNSRIVYIKGFLFISKMRGIDKNYFGSTTKPPSSQKRAIKVILMKVRLRTIYTAISPCCGIISRCYGATETHRRTSKVSNELPTI